MPRNFVNFLLEQPWLKVIRLLHISERPRSLQELADLTGMSSSCLQGALEYLQHYSVIAVAGCDNEALCSLTMIAEERAILDDLVRSLTSMTIRSRADLISLRRQHAVGWIDETIKVWRLGKRQLHNTSRTP